MKTYRTELINLAFFSLFAYVVLFYRLQKTDTLNFIYLAWNLVLAWVPYLVTLGLAETRYKLVAFLKIGLWLLFLPNAPYMITDMLHLHPRSEAPYWLDTFITFVFSFNGVLLFYVSTRAVWNYFQTLNRYLAMVIMPLCFILCGYGIYLGRWLRFNSWDAVHHPVRLTSSVMSHTFDADHFGLILKVTVLFGTMLFLGYRAIASFRQ
jgi:uncharacterized membrane protein